MSSDIAKIARETVQAVRERRLLEQAVKELEIAITNEKPNKKK